MRLKVLTDDSPILRQTALPVVDFGDVERLKRMVTDMRETLKDEGGIGLAAPQVGEDWRVILVCSKGNPDGPMRVFVNPTIIWGLGFQVNVEGCLSVPRQNAPVRRSMRVRLEAQSVNGKTFQHIASGLEAACIQHEINHLEGKLFIDLPKDGYGVHDGVPEGADEGMTTP